MLYQARELQEQLDTYILNRSGHEPNRSYLGMSQICRREEDLVAELLAGGAGQKPDIRFHERMRMGHVMEAEVKYRLHALGLLETKPKERIEVVADFDERFRGHVDGQLKDGSLLEIKSIASGVALAMLRATKRLRNSDFSQTQLYLAHGQFPQATLIFIARDTGEVWVTTRRLDPVAVTSLNDKARRILAEYDRRREAQGDAD